MLFVIAERAITIAIIKVGRERERGRKKELITKLKQINCEQ